MARIIYNGSSNQRVIGTNSADEILSSVPDTGSDTIFAQGGNDEVRTGGGNDLLLGGSGNDLLSGGGDNDRLFGGTGDDRLFGGNNNDTLAVETNLGDFGTDILSGGNGFDKIVFQTANVINVNGLPASVAVNEANAGVTVNMINEFVPGFVATFQQGAGGDIEVFSALETQRGFIRDSNGTTAVFNDIEQIDLTNFDDNIFDSSASHIINGRNGDDYISGGGGFDVIDGGNGNDTAVTSGRMQRFRSRSSISAAAAAVPAARPKVTSCSASKMSSRPDTMISCSATPRTTPCSASVATTHCWPAAAPTPSTAALATTHCAVASAMTR